MSKHYHVVENTPGYLPDADEPYIFTQLDSALDYAVDRAMEYWDMDDEENNIYSFSGIEPEISAHATPEDMRELLYTEVAEDHAIWISDASKTYDLGRVIEVVECEDPECEVPND